MILSLATLASGCGGSAHDEQQLEVLAAASLAEAFQPMETDFEEEHPDVDVQVVTGSSTDLAEQAADGAPGGVLATADEASMAIAADAGVVDGDPTTFATNRLVLVTRPGNPKGIRRLADLGKGTWVRCADEVPCGRLAVEALEEAGARSEPASLETDVKATLDRVLTGEADAALVYATDARSAGGAVETVALESDLVTSYPIAALEAGGEAASEWVDFVVSDDGRRILRDHGFATP